MMLANLTELACYLPGLIRRRLHNVGADGQLKPAKETFPAAILFADLSGFTALTEHLTHTQPDGTEELTQILDLYFGHLVRIVTAHGGDVIKFAGDGLIALWYGDEPLTMLTRRAVQCGLAIQMIMSPAVWSTEVIDETARRLRARVGIGAGDVTIMHLGGVFGRWELLIVGAAVRAAGAAEATAPPGEVALTTAAWELVQPWCEATALPDGHWRLAALLDDVPMKALNLAQLDLDQIELLRAYVPKAILTRIDAGQTAWLTEQRYVTVLFIHLADLTAETPLAAAQAAMRAIQTCLYRYEGSINRLGTDNKGPTLLAAFGLPPFAHEDDALRGLQAAHEIVNTLADLGFNCTIGVTSGQALCSSVGGQERREYTMMGSVVNRAARLMQAARQQGCPILCDSETAAACRDYLSFSALPPLRLRGIAEPVNVFQPLFTSASGHDQPALFVKPQSETLIGRASEMALLRERLEWLQRGQGSGLIITGEAGIGKSQLAQSFSDQARAQGAILLSGTARLIDRSPYNTLRAGLPGLLSDPRLTGLADAVYEIAHELWPATLIGQPSPPVPGPTSAERLRDALINLLIRVAERAPLVIVMEDIQWLDETTWSLLTELLDRQAPILLVLTGRPPLNQNDTQCRLLYHPSMTQLKLQGLSPLAIHDLLALLFEVEQVDEAIWRMIAEQTQGHPFYSIELAKALRDAGLLMRQQKTCRLVPGTANSALQMVRLPATVQGLITSRFDQLTLEQQLTLKAASVIGTDFDPDILAAIHPANLTEQQLTAQLFVLQQAGLITLEQFEPGLRYAFRPAAVAEAIYNLMSFAQRRQLHARLATYLEQIAGHDPARATTIAYHWQAAGELQRARPYLDRAGELALHTGDYSNAIHLLSQAQQIGDDQTPETMGRRERLLAEAFYCQGRLHESYQCLQRAFTHLGLPLPTTRRALLQPVVAEFGRQLLALVGLRLRMIPAGINAMEIAGTATILAQLDYYQRDPLTMLHSALRALNLAEAAGLPAARAQAYAQMEVALNRLPILATLYRRKAMRLARASGDPDLIARVAQLQGLAALGRGDWKRAAAALQLGLTLAHQTGSARRWLECRALLCMAQTRTGNFTNALAGAAEVVERGERARDHQAQVWGRLSAVEIHLAAGNVSAAVNEWQLASNLFTDPSRISRADQIWHTVLAARIAQINGDTDQARELALQALQQIQGKPPLAIYLTRSYEALTRLRLPWRSHWEAQFIRWQVGLIFPIALRSTPFRQQ
ncbi:AAA family ATPase [Chloroflexus sp.]|uniref:AAA family ATPase n=1 Tax=Chloroflexus sp. TaxID=1904827 RepID=UPI00261840DF|nr:adenylate/guanylate cyclase domain-containing protein [uncultured Chloroflexus sp.]